MLVGLAVFATRAKRTLGDIGLEPTRHPDAAIQAKQERIGKSVLTAGLVLLAIVIVLAATGTISLNAQKIGQNMTYVLVGVAVFYFAYIFIAGGLSSNEKKRVGVIGILFLFAAIFWSAFEQAPTSLNLFARDFTDRMLGGFEVPATWFQSINSLFIILLAPVFASIWMKLSQRGGELSSPAKFSLGLLFAGLGFVLMVFAANIVVSSGGLTKVSPWWLVFSYLFQTIGELCLSPVGLSSMTKLSPRKYVGQMMGIWFLATAVGNLIAGLVGGNVDPNKLDQMPKLFIGTSASLIVAGILLGLATPIIRRLLTPSTN
jgi:POT family proton-dependent oligopeptide transporter